MEFPVLFLGSKPQTTPALYSLMNYADTALGTWYPMGGMHGIVDAMVSVAKDQGVKFHSGQAVEGIIDLKVEKQQAFKWEDKTIEAHACDRCLRLPSRRATPHAGQVQAL